MEEEDYFGLVFSWNKSWWYWSV